jgi:hypothetical protein
MSRWEWVKLLLISFAISAILTGFYALLAHAVFRYG